MNFARPTLAVSAVAFFVAATIGQTSARGTPPAAKPAERHFTFFYTAEAHGTLEPCGCTSDPLGDVARYATLVRAARKTGEVLLVDAGGLSFPEGGAAPRERAGNELRATFLATELAKLGLAGVGLADSDLAAGPLHVVTPARMACNLTFWSRLKPAPSVLRTVGGIKVGVLGVVDPAVVIPLDGKAEDPVIGAKREAQRLRNLGAEIVIVLAPVDRSLARRIAQGAWVDFVVLGRQVGAGSLRADAVDRRVHSTPEEEREELRELRNSDHVELSPDVRLHAFILAPADELQKVGRVDVVLRGHGDLVDAGGPETVTLRRAELVRDLARIDAELASWSHPGSAADRDTYFIAAKRIQRDALAAEQARLAAPTWTPPATGSYFTNRLLPLRRTLPRDPAIASAMRALDAQIGKVNLRAAEPPPPAEPGRPFYVGMDKCASCHKPAMAFWRTTVHAQAWKTLVDGGKQADYKCVSCHVTGYGEIGGSSLGHTQRLENIQCETCHGPGSEHVAGKGLEDPPAIQRQAPSTVCTTCHNEHHSDTFVYNAYLRDILGPGHAASKRKDLGDGPTGRNLRGAALAKAKIEGKRSTKTVE